MPAVLQPIQHPGHKVLPAKLRIGVDQRVQVRKAPVGVHLPAVADDDVQLVPGAHVQHQPGKARLVAAVADALHPVIPVDVSIAVLQNGQHVACLTVKADAQRLSLVRPVVTVQQDQLPGIPGRHEKVIIVKLAHIAVFCPGFPGELRPVQHRLCLAVRADTEKLPAFIDQRRSQRTPAKGAGQILCLRFAPDFFKLSRLPVQVAQTDRV